MNRALKLEWRLLAIFSSEAKALSYKEVVARGRTLRVVPRVIDPLEVEPFPTRLPETSKLVWTVEVCSE